MTGLPKKRVSRSRQGNRRAHHALVAPTLVVCPNCRAKRLSHHVCPACGWFKGQQVITIRQPGTNS